MIVPLTSELANVLAFTMREEDVREIMAMRHDEYRHEFAEECAHCGGWCCLNKDGVPVAMGGVYECWPGVGNAWMVGTDDFARHGIEITRKSKKVLENLPHLHRIQAYSAAFHTVSHAWLERLGFRRGAVLPKLGKGGEDFIVFEIVR